MGGNDNDDNQEILLCEWIVKEKIVSPKCLCFLAKIDDLHLKCSILGGNPKNRTSGSTDYYLLLVRQSV
jgi:hypothetical protein